MFRFRCTACNKDHGECTCMEVSNGASALTWPDAVQYVAYCPPSTPDLAETLKACEQLKAAHAPIIAIHPAKTIENKGPGPVELTLCDGIKVYLKAGQAIEMR